MTIYWTADPDPANAETVTVWYDTDELATVDVTDTAGLPDPIGGIAPQVVREAAVDTLLAELQAGNSGQFTPRGTDVLADLLALEYEQGQPPGL